MTAPSVDRAARTYSKDDRLTVSFNTDTTTASIATGPNAGKRIGTVLYYSERPRETPTGGKYVSRGFTLRTPNGRYWYGTLKGDAGTVSVVRCRPGAAPKKV